MSVDRWGGGEVGVAYYANVVSFFFFFLFRFKTA